VSWLLHASLVEAKLRDLQLAVAVKAGFDPNQPRVPAARGVRSRRSLRRRAVGYTTSMRKTRSELAFERFLADHGIPYRPIPVGAQRTPDYGVTIGATEIIFEVKEIVSKSRWEKEIVHGAVAGDFIRRRIDRSRRQIQSASAKGVPTVLLIFNNYDPLQLFGTENHDFEQAMLGADTLVIGLESGRVLDRCHGDNKSFHSFKNTSFSALGRIKECRDNKVCITIFENIHARVPLDYDTLPACFEVVRVISDQRPHNVAQ
jgi:hypothetical protein